MRQYFVYRKVEQRRCGGKGAEKTCAKRYETGSKGLIVWSVGGMKVRKHIFFSGQVQGVGFRYRSAGLARTIGLTGWVRNLDDGRVEMEVQGELSAIRKLLTQLKFQRFIVIRHMDVADLPPEAGERGFSVVDY